MSFQDTVKQTVQTISNTFSNVVGAVKAHVAEVRAAQDDWNTKAEAYVQKHGIVQFEKAMKKKL